MPSLVQVVAGKTQTPPLTITLSATTPGNTLIALTGDVAVVSNGAVSGITLGGAAGNWAALASQGTGGDHSIVSAWADPSCAGGQTSVVISTTGGSGTENLFGWVLEWSGLLPGTLDKSSGGANGFAASWDSGATAATTQASEVWFGVVAGTSSGTPGLTGPASPWVNQAQQVSGSAAAMCGYQVVSSTGTADYAGTASPTNTADILVVTVKATAAVLAAATVTAGGRSSARLAETYRFTR